uniref:Apple domain-containing protein n=1 Tax=Emiliania huxleyi TaxID=2903 RepID=A0A7S3TPB9_EMIHU
MENLFDGELGYPIYGPLPNTELATLDACNGRRSAAGGYQYHARTMAQVNLSEPYCGRLGGRANNWNLVLGCFHGVVPAPPIFRSPADAEAAQAGARAAASGAMWTSPTNGRAGCCRTSSDGVQSPAGSSFSKAPAAGLDECKARCAALAGCTALEFNTRSSQCEVHRSPLVAYVALGTPCVCLLRVASPPSPPYPPGKGR